ncbi:MAG: hypothetical protein RsTaC01_0969 [Candidatus Paraimprobicoccus trichonymphae]|uniref:Uncharacterized protein n=1 Tax=Candidatus Paraimprobicoccus trichonymphae TaxID=3033793 RepID=A0AA48KY34_9FIRM|nr:MAG: hypothetical protein RsTaC01_0969 [Candidatus Paraimprobicoccus trichonymphae]
MKSKKTIKNIFTSVVSFSIIASSLNLSSFNFETYINYFDEIKYSNGAKDYITKNIIGIKDKKIFIESIDTSISKGNNTEFFNICNLSIVFRVLNNLLDYENEFKNFLKMLGVKPKNIDALWNNVKKENIGPLELAEKLNEINEFYSKELTEKLNEINEFYSKKLKVKDEESENKIQQLKSKFESTITLFWEKYKKNVEDFKKTVEEFSVPPEEADKINELRFLFLQHLKIDSRIFTEKKDFDYKFESAIDDIFNGGDFETFFDSE